jgi:hypothetical protein
MNSHTPGLNPASKPSGTGCVECSSSGGWWLHLRRCAECGHVGCCDSSPNQHASRHAREHGHPIAASFEPGEEWFYDYELGDMVDGIELLPPRWRPREQAAPGPSGRVPPEWRRLLR